MHYPISSEARVLIASAGFSALATAVMYFSVKRASVATLKSVLPWVKGGQWVMWLAVLIALTRQTLMDKPSALALVAYILYFPALASSGWIRGRLQFADPPNWNARKMAWLLHIPGHTYVEINNAPASAAWYVEKLGLRRLVPDDDADPKVIRMKFSDGGEEMRLGPHDPLSLGSTVMLYSRRLRRAREVLCERGVEVGPLEVDRQGTSYFEFRDPEGNTIEVCGARPDS